MRIEVRDTGRGIAPQKQVGAIGVAHDQDWIAHPQLFDDVLLHLPRRRRRQRK